MTQATINKVRKLAETRRENLQEVKRIGGENSPFASSAAKYYPALKELAKK